MRPGHSWRKVSDQVSKGIGPRTRPDPRDVPRLLCRPFFGFVLFRLGWTRPGLFDCRTSTIGSLGSWFSHCTRYGSPARESRHPRSQRSLQSLPKDLLRRRLSSKTPYSSSITPPLDPGIGAEALSPLSDTRHRPPSPRSRTPDVSGPSTTGSCRPSSTPAPVPACHLRGSPKAVTGGGIGDLPLDPRSDVITGPRSTPQLGNQGNSGATNPLPPPLH